jgi:hypothetical protein
MVAGRGAVEPGAHQGRDMGTEGVCAWLMTTSARTANAIPDHRIREPIRRWRDIVSAIREHFRDTENMMLKPTKKLAWCALVILLHALTPQSGLVARTQEFEDSALRGTSERGANWIIEMPEDWNGTVLVWSHGWSPACGKPRAPLPERERAF